MEYLCTEEGIMMEVASFMSATALQNNNLELVNSIDAIYQTLFNKLIKSNLSAE